MRSPIVAAALLAVAGCSVQQAKQAPETPKAEPANILHISRGGIAYPDLVGRLIAHAVARWQRQEA